MKLNKKPNKSAIGSIWAQLAPSLPLISLLVAAAECLGPPKVDPEMRVVNQTQQLNRDVTDLRLTSDFRAVKLRWSYEHNETNVPASFSVRYCELTSWSVEIKCRQRQLRVESTGRPRINGAKHNETSVIQSPIETVHQLDPPNGANFEAHIFDLRALTNYTFQVQVERFTHEPLPSAPANQQQQQQTERRQRTNIARWLQVGSLNDIVGRIETKPFSAEATRCLADASEVLINTGRFFGGRISVEDSTDPRCSLLGNRSSEQSTYLFRIDHEACASKVVDGNRIETMVLVHENKDILTHNTARFLVLCNFLQKSFTLKASVSLPKIRGVHTHSRPALITSLASRPNASDEQAMAVKLGSMPGVYRTHPVTLANATPIVSNVSRTLNDTDTLDSNTIDKSSVVGQQVRRSKELAVERRLNANAVNAGDSRAQALYPNGGLTSDRPFPGAQLRSQTQLQPVQVQSKVLFIERANDDSMRVGRQQYQLADGRGRQAVPSLVERSNVTDTVESVNSAELTMGGRSKQFIGQNHGEELSADLRVAPITMTNNHQIAGDYPPMMPSVANARSTMETAHSGTSPADGGNGENGHFSIRYSAAKVDEFPLGRRDDIAVAELSGGQVRSRAGRMRTLDQSEGARLPQQARAVNRIGEGEAGEDLVADTSNETADMLVTSNSSLAQNISSYLLKWSLKTLTNLARKSLESLANGANFNDTAVMSSQEANSTPFAPLEVQHDQPRTQNTTSDFKALGNLIADPRNIIPAEQTFKIDTINEIRGEQTTSPEPFPLEAKVSAELLLDKFMASRSHLSNTTGRLSTQRQTSSNFTRKVGQITESNQTRHSNYSKSLDLSRERPVGKQRVSDEVKFNLKAHNRPLTGSGDITEQSWWDSGATDADNRPIQSSLLLYAALLMVPIITVIAVAFWVIWPSNSGRPDRPARPDAFDRPTSCGDLGGAPDGSIRDGSYLKYDYNKLENYSSGAIGKSGLLTVTKMRGSSQHSPSTGSRSTRSTSASSTLAVDENDCKNNEFLYTEHVLINTGSSLGESYA